MSIRITCEETHLEILARIAKATARHSDCSMTIDFHDGNRRIEFSGDPSSKEKIAHTLATYFEESLNKTATEASSASEDV